MITRADELGGAQVHVRDLAAALLRQGEDVSVLAGGDGILFEQLAGQGVPFCKLKHLIHPIKPWKDWKAYREIRAVLSEISPDLVTTHSNKAGLLGRLAARSLKIPAVHTSHGFLFGGRQQKASGRFYSLMENIAARIGDKVIAVAESEFTLAEDLRVINPERMTVIHNGLPDLDPPQMAVPEAEPPVLIMVARFAEPKDHLTLLKALSGLKQLNWSLQLAGNGAGRPRAERLAEDLGIAERINFSGVCEDVSARLAASQIFVLSSRREGFPLTVLEAMRAGLPVIASDVGGIGEAVEDEKTGFLFPPGDVERLKFRLERLINDPQLRQKMGKAGRARFLKHFTLEPVVNKTLLLYRELVAGKACRK